MTKKIFSLTLGALLFALCVCAEVQQQAKKIPRIGVLRTGSSPDPNVEGFRRGLRELGYVEGQNIAIEYRWAKGKTDQLPDLAAELVRLNVDVIVTGGSQAARAAKNATSAIPIVTAAGGDPVSSGLVASLARPGGNVTGLTNIGTQLSGKRLELLKEIAPGIIQVAVLANPANPTYSASRKEVEAAAPALRIKLQLVEVGRPSELDKALTAIGKERSGAVLLLADEMLFTQRARIVEFALKNRLPAVFDVSEFVEIGGLLSYGPNLPDIFRRAATYVDKILKGAKPADLPVEQPTTFELVINLKTANQLGLTLPPNLLARADRVIR
ncbi:MAG: ABC transporter substrate-binding protein [Deltaproteobacteria bacterium]|jgi:ABC-type uncharacterized transport system substrate-binding protein